MDELGSQLWPIHLKPRPGELLSSWMIRLAHGHGYKTEKMCCMLFGRQHSLWCRDIDKFAPDWVLSKLCLITGTSMSRAVQTTLADYAGFVTEQINPNGDCPWIVPAHIYHRQRTSPGLMYCPICLKRDEAPYFRRIWRLAFITMCTTHGVHLLDCCTDCGAAVMPHRVDIGPDAVLPRDRSLIRCWKCGFDLSAAPTTIGSADLQIFTQQLEEIAQNGYLAIESNPSLHSVLYFAGIRIVAHLAVKLRGLTKVSIERLPILKRREVMLDVSTLMKTWPKNFLDALSQNKVRYSDLVVIHGSLPFWITKCVDTVRLHIRADWSSEEIAEVARVILNRHGRLTAATIRSKYGIYLPWDRLPSIFHQSVSSENHEMLMAILDQSVSATFDPKRRFAFLQDKVMFCLYRFTGMSTLAIHDLRMSAIELFTLDSTEVETMHSPCNREEAIRMLQRHIKGARLKITVPENCPYVFFSPYTGQSLSDSAIETRFQNAVKQAFLTAVVPNMSAYKVTTHSV